MAKLKLHSANLSQESRCVDTGVYWQSQLTSRVAVMMISMRYDTMRPKFTSEDTVCMWCYNIKCCTGAKQISISTRHYSNSNLKQQMCTTITRVHHLTYAALSAAFDSISQSQLWLLLTRLRISDKIVSVIRALYSNSVSSARVSQSQSAWFTTESGVHQGCVLAPDGLLLGGRLVDCTDV